MRESLVTTAEPQGFTKRERAQARVNIRAAVMREPTQAIVYGLDLLDLLSSSLSGGTDEDTSAILITKTPVGNWSSDGTDTAPVVGPWIIFTFTPTTESVAGETEEDDEDYPTISQDVVQWLVTYWDDGAQDMAFDWRSEALEASLAEDLFSVRYWSPYPDLENSEWEDDAEAAAGGLWILPLDPPITTGDVAGLTAALAAKVDTALLGVAGGVATLDGTGVLEYAQLPPAAYVLDLDATAFASLRATRGVHVDDFYDVADGTDNAPSIRAAIAYALANGIDRISFSPKVYNLQSTVETSIYHATNSRCAIKIDHSATTLDNLIIAGNGATLYMSGNAGATLAEGSIDDLGETTLFAGGDAAVLNNLGDFFYVCAAVLNFEIHDLRLERNHVKLPHGECCAGLVMNPVAGKAHIRRVLISNCEFVDCHRALHFSVAFPCSTVESYGQLKTLIIRNCHLDYPRGSNLVTTLGGGQGALFQDWVNNLIIDQCSFDGASTGDVSSFFVSEAVDGFFFCHALNTRVTNCWLKHFQVEGMYFVKDAATVGTEGTIDIPAPGGTRIVTIPVYAFHSLTGWLPGDKFVLKNYLAGGEPIVPTHELQVNSIAGQIITATVLSGPALLTTDGKSIDHEQSYNTRTFAAAINNVFTEVQAIGTTSYICIEFFNMDFCLAEGNYVERCKWGLALRFCRAANLSNNILATDEDGIIFFQPGELAKTTITGNSIELLGTSGEVVGINAISGAIISENHIFMKTPISGVGFGIRMANDVRDVIVTENVFTDLAIDVQNESFVNLQYHYHNNVSRNVEVPQTRFPETFANDADAAAGGIQLRGVYQKSSGVLAWRQA